MRIEDFQPLGAKEARKITDQNGAMREYRELVSVIERIEDYATNGESTFDHARLLPAVIDKLRGLGYSLSVNASGDNVRISW